MNNGKNGVGLAVVAVIICFTIGCLTSLIALGRPVDQLIYLVVLIAAPTITGIINLNNTSKIKDKVDTVEKQTNGNLSRQIKLAEKAVAEVTELKELLKSAGLELPNDKDE